MNSNVNSDKENNNTNHDMFRATKLWNEVLHAFYDGIPVKKHRKYMKCYNECFIASDAVQWLHNYLRNSPHFSSKKIQRCQALRLLQKYENSGYIENVLQKSDNKKFDDNKELFRFTDHMRETQCVKSDANSCENALKDVSNVQISKPILLNISRNNDLTKQTDKIGLIARNDSKVCDTNVKNDLSQYYSLCCGRSTGVMTVPTNRRFIRLLSEQNQLPYAINKPSFYEKRFKSFSDENDCLNYDTVKTKSVRILGKPSISITQHITKHSNSYSHQNVQNSALILSNSYTQNYELPANVLSISQSKSETQPPYSLQLFLRTEWTEV